MIRICQQHAVLKGAFWNQWRHLHGASYSTMRHVQYSTPESKFLTPNKHAVSNPSLLGCSPSRHFSRQTFAWYLSTDNPPIGYAYQLLEGAHTMTGLPWWATIMLTTFAARSAVTFPMTLYASHVMNKVAALRPEQAKLSKELMGEIAHASKVYGWDKRKMWLEYNINMQRLTKDLYVRDNCHPAKSYLVVLFQLPLWVSFSLALRNMAGAIPLKGVDNIVMMPSLVDGGCLWFTNFLLPDPIFILPAVLGIFNVAVNEMYALSIAEPSKIQKAFINIMRVLTIFLVGIACVLPSCMCFYWCCSSGYGLLQNILLRLPRVRKALRMTFKNESKTPFRDMYKMAKQKYQWKTNKTKEQ